MFQVTLCSTALGSVVVKTATGAEIDQLRSEGERLAAAAHPGVVEVVESSGNHESWTLTTVHGGSTLESQLPLSADVAMAVATSLAATLADIHERGVVHGRIDATHVLLRGRRRARLCGFGGRDEATGKVPADDVAALGRLIGVMAAADQPPRLGRVAALASADPPACRPSARQVVGMLARDVSPASRSAPRHLKH